MRTKYELPSLLHISTNKSHRKDHVQLNLTNLYRLKPVAHHKICALHRTASALGGLATAPGKFNGDEVSKKEYCLLSLQA
jgi:hypothetical protein